MFEEQFEFKFFIILQYKKVGKFLVFNLKNFPTFKNEETLIFRYLHRFDSRLLHVEVRSRYRKIGNFYHKWTV